MNASSCNECLCAMFPLSSMNPSILSLKCIDDNSNGVIYELFNHTINQNSNSSHVKINLRSTFYFRLLLASGQSESTSLPSVTTTMKGALFRYSHCLPIGIIVNRIRETDTLCSLVSNSFTLKVEEDL